MAMEIQCSEEFRGIKFSKFSIIIYLYWKKNENQITD